MAVSYANREAAHRGTWTWYLVDITLDSSYATSGEAVNAADFGFTVIRGIWPSHAEGYTVEMVRSSDSAWLIKVYGETATTNTIAAEMVSAKDLSSVTIPCIVIGR
jgi:hypothetical protein